MLPLNQRQKIVLCNVNNQEILLAVSGQSITSLAHWVAKDPLETNHPQKVPENGFHKNSFKEKIAEVKNLQHIGNINDYNKTNGELNNKLSNDLGADSETNRKEELDNTNDLLALAKRINQSIRKNISENAQ